MDIGKYMAGLAERIDQKKGDLGLEGVSYPADNYVAKSPWLMVRQSLYGITTVSKARGGGRQVVTPAIDLVCLVKSDPKRPGDASRLDQLIHPVLDLFDAKANGGNVNYAFTGILDGDVDHVWDEAIIRRSTINWGESGHCYALIITLDSSFQRKAELP